MVTHRVNKDRKYQKAASQYLSPVVITGPFMEYKEW